MNEACKSPIKTKSATGKPNVPKNKATLGALDSAKYSNIDPASTPVSSYTKKSK